MDRDAGCRCGQGRFGAGRYRRRRAVELQTQIRSLGDVGRGAGLLAGRTQRYDRRFVFVADEIVANRHKPFSGPVLCALYRDGIALVSGSDECAGELRTCRLSRRDVRKRNKIRQEFGPSDWIDLRLCGERRIPSACSGVVVAQSGTGRDGRAPRHIRARCVQCGFGAQLDLDSTEAKRMECASGGDSRLGAGLLPARCDRTLATIHAGRFGRFRRSTGRRRGKAISRLANRLDDRVRIGAECKSLRYFQLLSA